MSARIPDVPTGVSAVRGDTTAVVSFTEVFDGGASISAYHVFIVETSATQDFTGGAAVSPLTVTGLTNGNSYTFKVKASNFRGDSALSAATSPAVVPGASA